MAVYDRQLLPFLSGKFRRSGQVTVDNSRAFLDGEKELISVGLAKPALGDSQITGLFKLLEIGANAALPRPHIIGQGDLAGKAGIIRPCVFEQHGISELGTNAQFLGCQDKIGNLGEPACGGRVGSDKLDISVFDNV